MADFGKGLKRKTSGGGDGGVEAPAPKLGKRAPIPLEELDLSKIEFGKKVEKGNQGDQFVRATYVGERIELSLAALPKWSRAPFAAGPPKTADGAQLGTSWGFAVELTMEQYEKFAAYEAHVVKSLMPLRNELFPAEAKKKKGGMTEEAFADKYNSKLTPPNPEKGYAPTLRIFIETDTERQMPKIQLMKLLEGNKCTRPVQGSADDLKAKSAVAVIISLSRGVYAGQTGLGCKFAGTAIDVLTNLQQSNAPEPDYSGVTFVDDPTPTHGAAPSDACDHDKDKDNETAASDAGEQTYTNEQFDDALAGQQV